ncbi:dephospho-CoA kinase [Flavobacterium psychrophilum]|uniref:dephospho-CoA kinase n=1 Tax=Flavobacterium psychrophilum TaxID=96345 RepID=UPI000B7C3882|nr:dephospho-CoA kinase [Flavobacterium psychrophilum]EKT3964849.1 dephospho-CoA kinase [Flavobacterium psychrophilum]EKT4518316.1 dephospho-CoA kinase [Flavobacterium psychrophilum]EKT4548901.1 dephospho-CoA kinase [Flavobacterium psychrophilum]ELM3644103.1 dephospho-CoA kinase [Flavobacterium psychrophilum]SNA79583.1 Dephospho-CoA kinase [Flavobacterium psychrophilum]
MTKIIGLTGGIGSGKTTIVRLFEAEGIPVYIADDEAKKIMILPETIHLVRECFGQEVIVNHQIDRKKLSEIVFNHPEKLKELNKIIHPLVKKHFDNWVKKQKSPFVIKETAILFESGSYKYCDQIITVIASEETRVNRVMLRDKCTKEAVLERIKNQYTDSQKTSKSDYIIENENLNEAKLQFSGILKKLKNLY